MNNHPLWSYLQHCLSRCQLYHPSRQCVQAVPAPLFKHLRPFSLASLLLLLLLLIVPVPYSGAQAELNGSTPAVSEGNSAESEEGKELIFDVTEALSIDESLEKLDSQYQQLLNHLGISDGLFGALASSVFIMVLFFIVKFIMKSLLNSFVSYVLRYKDKYRLSQSRINFYHSSIKTIFVLIIFCIAFLGILKAWSIDLSWISLDAIQSFTGGLVSLLLVVAIGIVVVEIVSGLLENHFNHQDLSTSRIGTIKPITKNIVIGVIFFIFGMVALSQLGIDILPLLAGAGVLGIAVGFGAQALVKDVITGFIIILEDLIQVGDVVTLNEKTGKIEKITIRKVQVRDIGGTVYTIPFGEISIVENHTKIFSYYLTNIGVAYRENIDDVITLLHEIGSDLKSDKEFSDSILEDLEILGLDEFADSAVIIKARIKTQPKQQWTVGREFNRRVKIAFDNHNIEIPFPHQTIYIGEDKRGNSPPLNLNIAQSELTPASQET